MLGINVHEGTAEGWFGQGKLSAIISIVVIAILVLGIAGGIFVITNGGEKISAPSVAKNTPVTAGTIQIPDGPKVTVKFSGPAELEAKWEKLGMVNSQLQLIGTLTNVSGQTVKFSEIAFLLDDQQVAYDNGRTLKPGEQIKIAKAFPAVVPGFEEYAKILEVKIKGFEVIGGSATTTEPTISSSPEVTDTPTKLVYKSNPGTPSETFLTYLSLACSGKYEEAIKFWNLDMPIGPTEISTFQNSWEGQIIQERKVIRIEVTKEEVTGNLAIVSAVIYYENSEEDQLNNWRLEKKDNKWWLIK